MASADVPCKRTSGGACNSPGEHERAHGLALRTRRELPFDGEGGEKFPNAEFAEVVWVDPSTGPMEVEAEEIFDPTSVAFARRRSEVHGPAGGVELIEQFHGKPHWDKTSVQKSMFDASPDASGFFCLTADGGPGTISTRIGFIPMQP